MGSLLAQSSPRHLTHELLSALQTLLAAVGPCEELVHDVLRHLVVNLRLWRAAPAEVQQHLVLILLQLAQVMCYTVLTIPGIGLENGNHWYHQNVNGNLHGNT